MALTEDLAVFLNDFGVSCTAGAITALGILDMPTQVLAGEMVLSTDYTLTTRFADFGGLVYGDSITVGGVNYQVREVRQLDDGAMCEIGLMRLSPGQIATGGQPREWSIGDLADVDVTGAEDGDVLVRENGVWVDGQDDNGIAISVALE
jgi:hypothetical protein